MKQRALLIAEKPSARRDMEYAYSQLSSSYPYEIDFVNARGHLVSLQEPDDYCDEWKERRNPSVLPMIPEHWLLKVCANKEFQEIKDKLRSGEYDFVINACDPGREGFLIFDNIYKKAACKLPIKRLWFDDQTPSALKHAFQNLKDYDDYLGYRYSALFRSVLDWLIGMNFSRAAAIATDCNSFIIGRCITVILALIVSVEKEIQNFTPEDYFEYAATFTTKKGETYEGILVNPNNAQYKHRFPKREVLERLPFVGKTFTVSEIEAKDVHSKPKHLFTLTDLQAEASRLFDYNPDETLKIAQRLYEKHKILSYPRTDCEFITTDIAKSFPKLLRAVSFVPELSEYAEEILEDTEAQENVATNKRFVNNKKISDHPALIPTNKEPDWDNLNEAEKNIYTLVAKRFLAMFMPDYVYNKVILTTTLKNAVFLSQGKTVVQIGWKELYDYSPEDVILPNVEEGESVLLSEGDIKDKKTQPPSRYTNESLLLAMKNVANKVEEKDLASALKGGIGTSATRAEQIAKIMEYGWTEYQKKGKTKHIVPTEKGIAMIESLSDQIIISPSFTASWEQKFIDMETSNTVNKSVYTEIVDYVTANTQKLLLELKPNERLKDQRKEIGTCPWCNQRPVIEGKASYYCSGYLEKDKNGTPGCIFGFKKKIAGATLTIKDATTLIKTGSTPEKTFTKKDKSTFPAKLVYSVIDDKNENGDVIGKRPSLSFSASMVGSCPVCSENVISLNKVFKCTNNDCNFVIFKSLLYPCNTTITEKDASNLLAFKKIKKECITKQKRKYPAYLFLEKVDEGEKKGQYTISKEYVS